MRYREREGEKNEHRRKAIPSPTFRQEKRCRVAVCLGGCSPGVFRGTSAYRQVWFTWFEIDTAHTVEEA